MRIAAIALSVVGILVVFTAVLIKVIIPTRDYNDAVALMENGQYEEAIRRFEALGDYKDSAEKLSVCKYDRAVALIDSGDYEAAYILLNGLDYKDSASKRQMIEESDAWLRICPVGGVVSFGSYEQDNNTSNGKEDIEWLVLAKEDDRVLLISKYALDYQPYNTSNTSVTWETCSLRKWLNGTFLNGAFSAEERAMIPSVTVSADKNLLYSTSPGNSTTDQMFLLSITEMFKFNLSRCAPTAYAIAQGAKAIESYKVDGKPSCGWWLRSPGSDSFQAAYVTFAGLLRYSGASVCHVEGNFDNIPPAVRPALWVTLGS